MEPANIWRTVTPQSFFSTSRNIKCSTRRISISCKAFYDDKINIASSLYVSKAIHVYIIKIIINVMIHSNKKFIFLHESSRFLIFFYQKRLNIICKIFCNFPHFFKFKNFFFFFALGTLSEIPGLRPESRERTSPSSAARPTKRVVCIRGAAERVVAGHSPPINEGEARAASPVF